ncbi:unnamed protein product [Mytilus coruscus]|uniref:Uncharacterized protein n=1 Tax=Mytilus coruscus TaxID=42192 RepID=A0A6J8D968_MYTCO|nr:unnamed protein product [Mytilus coruscus]
MKYWHAKREVDQPYHYRTSSNLPVNLTEVEEVDQPCQFRDRLHLPVMDTEVEEVDQLYHFRARLHMPVMNNDIKNSQLNDYKSSEESRQESSQECTIETSQGSSWSYNSSTLPERNFELLNTTLSSWSHGAVSPLRSNLPTPFIESADRTKRYYKRKAGQLISTLLDTIAPGQGDILLDAMSNEKKSTAETSSSEDITSTIVRLYNESTDTGYKVKILSIIVNKHSKSTLQGMIPGITVYRIDQARQHALLYGRGSEEDLVHTTEKDKEWISQSWHMQCSLLENFKLEMQNAFRQLPPTEQLKDLQYDFETAIAKIDEWKKHILRTVNQARAKTDILDNLQSHQMLIIMDWAMKYLPNMFREKQSDCIEHLSTLWILPSKTGTVSLLLHALTTIKQQLPEIEEVFRSDNAMLQVWTDLACNERTKSAIRLAHTSCSSSKKDDGFTLDALVADDDDDLRAIVTTFRCTGYKPRTGIVGFL